MATIDEKERNLANATETLGQFYCEIESFLDILYAYMQRSSFSAKAERLRSRTITTKNLSRRLLATAMVVYGKHVEDDTEQEDEDEPDGEEEDDVKSTKLGKQELQITAELRIPFVHLALFEPTTIPMAKTLERPTLYIGAIGQMSFLGKKSSEPAFPEQPVMTLVNLANIRLKSKPKKRDSILLNIWKPSRMKKFKLMANFIELEKIRLLEIDSQEKIRSIAEKLAAYANA